MFEVLFAGIRRPLKADASLDDKILVKHFQESGDGMYLVMLLERYQDLIIGMSMNRLKDREAVQDFASELYLILQKKIPGTEIDNFKSWLCTIVRNRLSDMYRKKKVRQDYAADYLKSNQDGVEEHASFQFDQQFMIDAMNELSNDEQKCIQLIYLQERSYQEIMEETKWTFNKLRGLRQRGMKKLKDTLGPEFAAYFNQE